MYQDLKNIIALIIGITFLVIISPVLLLAAVLFFLSQTLSSFFIYVYLKDKNKKFILFNRKDSKFTSIIDEQLILELRREILIFPEECSSRFFSFFISKQVFKKEPTIVLSNGRFSTKNIPLQKALIKYQKRNPISLKNILFKLKTANVAYSSASDIPQTVGSLTQIRDDIVEELVKMAESQENASAENYLISMEDYEEDLKFYNDPTLDIAWRFIEYWCDETEHNFQGFYYPIKKNDWPEMARSIAISIKEAKPIRKDIASYFRLYRTNLTGISKRHVFNLLAVVLIAGLFLWQCNRDRPSPICYQIKGKDCL